MLTLSLDLSKSEEIVFIDKRRKSNYKTPEMLNALKRIQHIKILGVTFTNGLSVTFHIQQLIASNAQILYALIFLRAHGLCDTAIQAVEIFHSVVLARYPYASRAWWSFAGVQDRQKEDFCVAATGPDFVPKTYLTLVTFAWRLIKIYSVRYWIIQNMRCINIPQFLPLPTVIPLEHAPTTDN